MTPTRKCLSFQHKTKDMQQTVSSGKQGKRVSVSANQFTLMDLALHLAGSEDSIFALIGSNLSQLFRKTIANLGSAVKRHSNKFNHKWVKYQFANLALSVFSPQVRFVVDRGRR